MPIVARVGYAADCAWSGNVIAWIDKNADGKRDPDELPLAGVRFHVDDTVNHFVDVGRSSAYLTNWNGESGVSVFLPGCPRASFEVYPEIPAGYQLTTASRLNGSVRETGRTYEFGFNYLPGAPTATPRPPPPRCAVYKIGVADQYDVTDVAIGPDGTVWASTYNHGVARYMPAQDQWVYMQDGPPNSQVRSITITPNNVVWFATEGGAARYDGIWKAYTTADGLVQNSVYQIALASDGSYWFATQGGLSHFSPARDSWSNYTSQSGFSGNFVSRVAVMPDGLILASILSHGVFSLQPRDPQHENFAVASWSSTEFDDIKVAPDGSYWLVDLHGVERYDPATRIRTTYNVETTHGAFGEGANALAIGPDGSVWIAAGNEAAKIYQLIPSKVQGAADIWRVYDARNGLPKSAGRGDSAKAITVAKSGAVWIATQETVTRCAIPNP